MKADAVVNVTNPPGYFGRAVRSRKLPGCLLLIIGLGLGPMGCATSNPNPASAGPAHSPHAANATPELNNGKKWVVVPPMMAHLRKLERAVLDFETTSARDHAALGADIQENLGRLVTNCTMEGKAHDELHKWLMPFLGVTANYAKATEPRVQQEKFEEIKQALVVFNAHFE
jgi:hypothetical protein